MPIRWNTIFLIVCPLIVGILVHFLTYKADLVIWPGHKKVGYYSDSLTVDHGNSIISKLPSDSSILKFEYTLGPKYNFPYVGVTFEAASDTALFDLSKYDEIIVDLAVDKSRRIPIVVNEDIKNYSKPTDALSYRSVTKELECFSGRNSYTLTLSDFYVPSWWYYIRHITAKEAGPINFSRIHNIQIHHCELLPQNTKEIFSIHKVYFHKRMEWIWGWMGFGLVFYFLTWYFFGKIKPRIKKIFPGKELPLGNQADEDFEKLLSYLAENYTRPELSLEKIQKDLGLSESKISVMIKEHSGLNFKRYLNDLRLREAKRLLTETDRKAMDIAYQVGYGNISHFNRVFKESEGCSPTEFRKKSNESH